MNETRAPLGKTLFLIFKLAVSGLLLAYLLSGTDLRALVQRVRTGDTLLLAVAVLCYALMLVLSTWRWQLLLSAQGYPAPLRDLTRLYSVLRDAKAALDAVDPVGQRKARLLGGALGNCQDQLVEQAGGPPHEIFVAAGDRVESARVDRYAMIEFGQTDSRRIS